MPPPPLSAPISSLPHPNTSSVPRTTTPSPPTNTTTPRPLPTTTPLSPRRIGPRPLVLSLSIAAIAATGAYYGASLKSSRDTQTAVKQQRAASPEARITYLEERRARMVGVKRGLEERIEGLRDRAGRGPG